MGYLSLPKLLEARNHISNNVSKPETFLGLVLFLFCVVESKKNGFSLKADMKLFSELADDAFYLAENKNQSNENKKYWFCLLTKDWLEQARRFFLKDKKISLKCILHSLFWRKNYDDILYLLNKNIPEYILNGLFLNDLSKDDFTEITPINHEQILSEFAEIKDGLTIKFDGSFVKKRAGDLSAAPFSQTLYSSLEIKKIISIFEFDPVDKFNLSPEVDLAYRIIKKTDKLIISKPFLLLAGISGTGKTRFVRDQAVAIGSLNENYCLTPVRPDWHEPSDLLGYVSRLNGDAEYIATDVLQFMAKAWRAILDSGLEIEERSSGKHGDCLAVTGLEDALANVMPYWLCLDEMNLAPVEQYFSDYLSIIETREWICEGDSFSYLCDPLLKAATIQQVEDRSKLRDALGFNESKYDKAWELFCQYGLGIPFNLIVAGTVNMDETTHGFSRKVIDRALSFDFGEFFPNNFEEFFEPKIQNKILSYPVLSHANHKNLSGTFDTDGHKSIAFLNAINKILDGTPFKLAYRALNELLLAVIYHNPQDQLELCAVWDDFLMCKVLPRIEGDSDKLGGEAFSDDVSILDNLITYLKGKFDDIWEKSNGDAGARPDLYREKADGSDEVIRIPCRSKIKLEWMKKRLENSGFTSFWP
ncbi:MAG: hypothetical protein WC982_03340 [Advenella sp.]